MISISFTAAEQYSEPMFVSRGFTLGISFSSILLVSGLEFIATIALQRLPAEDSLVYPLHSDTGFKSYLSKTGPYEDSVANLAPGWYR
jgi:hypothetical protein